MLTAATLINRACQISKGELYTAQGLDLLNSIQSDLCETYDLALARGVFQFNFNPSLSTMFGSGPYPLPLDYLRTSGSSGAEGVSKSAWYLYPTPAFPAGQPIYMVPIDLAEFDLYPQFPSSQTTPNLWATDMGGPLTQRIVLASTAAITAASTSATVSSADAALLSNGLSMAGEGIMPGTTITISGTTLTLSLPAVATIAAASVFYGTPPKAYVYPPPLGTYPVTVRYQKKMPDLTNTGQIPWFPNEGYLIEELSARLMWITDDSRAGEYADRALARLRGYLDLMDDKTNRAQAVQLDLRNYGSGSSWANARLTKHQGW